MIKLRFVRTGFPELFGDMEYRPVCVRACVCARETYYYKIKSYMSE